MTNIGSLFCRQREEGRFGNGQGELQGGLGSGGSLDIGGGGLGRGKSIRKMS